MSPQRMMWLLWLILEQILATTQRNQSSPSREGNKEKTRMDHWHQTLPTNDPDQPPISIVVFHSYRKAHSRFLSLGYYQERSSRLNTGHCHALLLPAEACLAVISKLSQWRPFSKKSFFGMIIKLKVLTKNSIFEVPVSTDMGNSVSSV